MAPPNRVLTGMRTTGTLHLGHYVGALKQWLEVQNKGEHDCFFLLADTQALTTHADRPELLAQSIREVVLDWLSVGLDPQLPHVHFVQQSQVLGRADLSVLLSMIAKYGEVMRNPTLRAEMKQQERGNLSMGFMVYPVDQAADILMVSPLPGSGAQLLVPVGKDQAPHLEYNNVLARRFNHMYSPVFTECQALIGEIGRLVGTDGNDKMSKSLGNTINLADSADEVRRKIMRMFTDPKRTRPDIPGETENNPVFIFHRALNPNKDEVQDLTERYETGRVGDVEVKRKLIDAIEALLSPMRERRMYAEKHANVAEILAHGRKYTEQISLEVLERTKAAMHLTIS